MVVKQPMKEQPFPMELCLVDGHSEANCWKQEMRSCASPSPFFGVNERNRDVTPSTRNAEAEGLDRE